MKTIQKIKTLLSTLLLIVFINSCSDLDQKFYGQIPNEKLWNSKTDFDQAINGAVQYLDKPYGYYTMHFFLMEDGATDYFYGNTNAANEYSAFQNWKTNYPTTFSWAVWTPMYESIYQCNLVLERLDKYPIRTGSEFEAEDLMNKAKIEGQAHFFRALNYYFAQNYFGGVPIVKSADDNRVSIAKSTRDEVRELVESDLLLAVSKLPNSLDAKADIMPSRPSKQAAYGLLARLYINWESKSDHWQKTSDACDAIITDNSDLGLEPIYSNIFSLTNEKNKEIVYAIEHNNINPASQVFLLNNYTYSPSDMLNPIGAQIGWGGNWQVKRIALYDYFANNDSRKKQILNSYINKNGNPKNLSSAPNHLVNKYPLDPKNLTNSFGGNDQPIIRYADILLMKAEALNNLSNLPGATILINEVRSRAGLGDLPSSINTFDLFNEEIYNERRREFFFEGLGRTDMIRFTDRSPATSSGPSPNYGKNKFLLWVGKSLRLLPDGTVAKDDVKTEDIPQGTQADEKYKLYPFDLLALRNNPKLVQNLGYN